MSRRSSRIWGRRSTFSLGAPTPPPPASTYNVLRGADLLGQLAALHHAQVQVLVEELPVQDVLHGVLQTPAVAVQHSADGEKSPKVREVVLVPPEGDIRPGSRNAPEGLGVQTRVVGQHGGEGVLQHQQTPVRLLLHGEEQAHAAVQGCYGNRGRTPAESRRTHFRW